MRRSKPRRTAGRGMCIIEDSPGAIPVASPVSAPLLSLKAQLPIALFAGYTKQRLSQCVQEGLGSLASSLSGFEDGIIFPPPQAGCLEGTLGAEERILARRPGIQELDLAIVAETGSWHPQCPPVAGCTGCSGWGRQRCSTLASLGMFLLGSLGMLWLRSLGMLLLGSLGVLWLGSLGMLQLGSLGMLLLGYLGVLWFGPWGCSGWGHQGCSGPGSREMLRFRTGDREDASAPLGAGAQAGMRPLEQQRWVWCEAKE